MPASQQPSSHPATHQLALQQLCHTGAIQGGDAIHKSRRILPAGRCPQPRGRADALNQPLLCGMLPARRCPCGCSWCRCGGSGLDDGPTKGRPATAAAIVAGATVSSSIIKLRGAVAILQAQKQHNAELAAIKAAATRSAVSAHAPAHQPAMSNQPATRPPTHPLANPPTHPPHHHRHRHTRAHRPA